jgi:hypothetical protein
MYGTTALPEVDRVDARSSDRESLVELEEADPVDGFLRAVSSGWPQVVSWLDSCDLDREVQEMLHNLQPND